MVAFAQTSIALLLALTVGASDATNLRQDQRDLSAMAQANQNAAALLARVNKERAAHGLKPVCSNKKLQAAAERHVKDQSKTDYISDTGTDDSNPETRVTDAGYKWQSVSEAIDAGNANADAVVDWWMRNEARETILGKYTMAGSAYAYNPNTYSKHTWVREANLDASNLDELNVAVAKQSQALGSSDLTKYDTQDLIRATQDACAMESQHGQFDWNTLGNAAGACFRSVPEISFLFGLMDTEVVRKVRKRARRAQEDTAAQEAQPTEYTNKKDRKDAQARRLEVLQSTLTTLGKREPRRRQPLFDVVINPKSFTQTVENLFDTSFLVRNSAAEVGIDEETGMPYIYNHEGEEDKNLPPSTQSIISITPAQWEQFAQVTGRDEPLLGHRT